MEVFTVVSQDRIQQRSPSSRYVDTLSGGQQDFHLGQGSIASASGAADVAGELFFFRTFPKKIFKSAKSSRTPAPIVPTRSSPWTPPAYGLPKVLEEEEEKEKDSAHVPDSVEWVQLSDDKGLT